MKKSCTILLLIFSYGFVSAQVLITHKKSSLLENMVFNKNHLPNILTVTIPDLEKIKQKELAGQKDKSPGKIFKFAESVPININIIEQMVWISQDSFTYGKVTIQAKKSKSLSFNFSDFYIPENTEIFIYDKTKKLFVGPITSKENNSSNTWGSPIIDGDEATIEVKVPVNFKSKIKLSTKNIACGYKDVYKFEEYAYGYGQSAPCHINASCPIVNGWDIQKNSIALVLDENGVSLSSGALINNSCNFNIPYFLTAEHAIRNTNISKLRFIFQFISATCTPSQDDEINVIYYGATERARYAPADAALLELNQVPSNSSLAYSGWSRSTGAIQNTTSLHHPQGDVMKFSRDNSPPVNATVESVLCHKVNFDLGIVEDGSSGAPLYDQNRRIIGIAFGSYNAGQNPCQITETYFGRFDVAWVGGGTNNSRLSNWLDPANTSPIEINSTYVASTTFSPKQTFFSGVSGFCNGPETFTLTNVPAGSSVSFSSSPSNIVTITPGSGYTATLSKISDGITTLTANVVTACGLVYTVNKEISVGPPPAYNYSICGYDPNQNCRYGTIIFSVYTNYISPATYSWYMNGVLMATTNDPLWSFVPEVPCDTYMELSVIVTTPCGTSPPAGEIIYYACSGSFFSYYSLSPNPAKGKVVVKSKISKETNESTNNKKYINEVRILNKSYVEIKRIKYSNFTSVAEIDLPSVPTDTYFISVFDGKKWYTEKLLISN